MRGRFTKPEIILIAMFILSFMGLFLSNKLGSIFMFLTVMYFLYLVAGRCSENYIFISMWLLFGPLFTSAFLGLFVTEFYPKIIFRIGDGTFIFLLIPILSVIFVVNFYSIPGFKERIKISIKINNILIVVFTFGFIHYAYSINDFTQLIPSLEELTKYNIGPREFIIFFVQVITFPYLISNLIIDGLLDILEYHKRDKNQPRDHSTMK